MPERAKAYRADPDRIKQRKLFGQPDPKQAENENGLIDEPSKINRTNLRLCLILVTYYGEGDPRNRAVIKNLRTGHGGIYAKDDKIADLSEIYEIHPDKVLLARPDGSIEELALGRPERTYLNDRRLPSGKRTGKAGQKSRDDSGHSDILEKIVKIGDSEYLIKRDAVQDVLDNLERFAGEAGLAPVPDNGNGARGFRLRARPDSLVERLGLSNGDVIRSVNGMDLDLETGMRLLDSLRSGNDFSLDIERRGQPLTIYYRIR